MATTAHLNTKPDFYSTKEECIEKSRNTVQTNPRYPEFTQNIFHAGDEEQFQRYRDSVNGDVCIPHISLSNNIFNDKILFPHWKGYENIEANAVINTFRYIFHKFKKGIFVKILNNELKVFLPFSKVNFTNEWAQKIQIDKTKYGNMHGFLKHVSEMENRTFNSRSFNENIEEWYGNNCLVRYEYPLSEGDTNVGVIKNMLEELCKSRKLLDIEFFVNRRDFPILTTNGTEPYNHIWESENHPLVSHAYPKYLPILSMSSSIRYADILMPTWEDWARIQSVESKWFPRVCKNYTDIFDTEWENKIPTAIFRGSNTGCGVTIETNARLKVSYISSISKPDEKGIPYIDAGISKWNVRPRKLQYDKYLRTTEIKELPFELSSYMTPKEQSKYKYIIHIDGHTSAFRLSMELSMGSVILLVKSQWKTWYTNMLIPYEHFVPVSSDLSDLMSQIKWCRNNDGKCKNIAKNAKIFFDTFLQKNGVFDYMQKIIIDMKSETGVYLYNTMSPLSTMIDMEHSSLDLSYPSTTQNISNISSIPFMTRCYGLSRGMEWIIRKIITEGEFENIAIPTGKSAFQNKLGTVKYFHVAGFNLAVKTTFDTQKIREHIHETYIGTKSLNEMSKFVPNFAYVFGMYRKDNAVNVITEYIHGETLHEYISSERFLFEEYLLILLQLCLALQMAQNICGFVHYDFTPWNIILQRVQTPVTFDYIISYDKIIRVKTTIIPVIIDYGKSHVIHDDIHHGFINMFSTNTVQDILTLLVTSIEKIASEKQLTSKDLKNLLILSNFLSRTKYRPEPFDSIQSIRTFFRKARKYSVLIEQSKYELESRRPYDLVGYIMKFIGPDCSFKLGAVKDYVNILNKGNARQVFEYVLAKTKKEKLQTYENVFIRLKHCTIPQPENLLFIYYVAQNLESNLLSVRENMLQFLENEQIGSAKYEKIFVETMRFLHTLYKEKIDNKKDKNVIYNLDENFLKLEPAEYNEETFLVPDEILRIKSTYHYDSDLSSYKNILETILLNNGTYKLTEEDRKYYMDIFQKLLSTSSLNMKNNTANSKTLVTLSHIIYQKDLQALENLGEIMCENVRKYVDIYSKF